MNSCELLQVINDLFKPDKREGELEVFLKQAELMVKEADRLQCNVTRDLEKLKASPPTISLSACTAVTVGLSHWAKFISLLTKPWTSVRGPFYSVLTRCVDLLASSGFYGARFSLCSSAIHSVQALTWDV